MKAFTTLYDDVLPELPGIQTALALHHIKRACIDFHERSLYSRTTLPAINIVAGTATYALAHQTPLSMAIAKVLNVIVQGRAMVPKTVEWLDGNPDHWAEDTGDATTYSWRTQQGNCRFYTQSAIDSVTLVGVPSAAVTGGLVVTVAEVPLYSSEFGIQDAVYDKFGEDIACGAKARLMRMPKKPWSDRGMAIDYEARFNEAIDAAAAIASKNYGRATLRTVAWG